MTFSDSIGVFTAASADMAYVSTVFCTILAIAMLVTSLWISYQHSWRQAWALFFMGGATGVIAFQLHDSYEKMRVLSNGASSEPFYIVAGLIIVGSLALSPIVALFVHPFMRSK
jgi:hypothetical protein